MSTEAVDKWALEEAIYDSLRWHSCVQQWTM